MSEARQAGLAGQLSLQVLAVLTAWFFIAPLAHPLQWAFLQGGVAALLCALWRQGRGAIIGQALFLPLVVAVLSLDLPSWAYLLAFALTLSLSWNTLLGRVPFYRSSRHVAQVLAQALAPGARILDAGSGDGRLALRLARARPDLSVTAMENAWGSAWLAYCRWLLAGRPANLKLECSNIWREDWGQYDVVYVFLSPAPMNRVWEKFLQQGRAGGMLISNTFEIPGVEPVERLPLSGHLQQSLLFWRWHHGTE